ncbi:MAG: hypothetical protein JO202_18845 [Ktedonobacteraceae bacterium]|nr:hypothetical protein [Ktedonobacteraceae bacterium]
MSDNKSEIAYFRQRQALEEEAAWLGLHGLASGTARHDVIRKRIGQGAERILHLLEEDKYQDVQKLMTTDPWGREVRRVTRCSRRDNTKEGSNG